MLITAKGTLRKMDSYTFYIDFNIPVIYLDSNDYTLSVRHISFQNSKTLLTCKFALNTTAIDKNVLNPDQELISFIDRGSHYIFYNPHDPLKYKIQLKEFHTAEYILSSTRTVDLFDIKDFKIIFEIIRDVRIQ